MRPPRPCAMPESAASGAAMRPPPQMTHRVGMVVPSDSVAWPGPISLTETPSRIRRPRAPAPCDVLVCVGRERSEHRVSEVDEGDLGP